MPVPRPPLPWLIAYRLVGVRLPDQYRAWVAHDIAAKNFVNWRIGRTLFALLTLLGLFYVAQVRLFHAPSRDTLRNLVLLILAVGLLGSRKSYMRRARTWQRIDARGNPVPPKGLGLLDNAGATVLGVAVLIAFTAASGLYAVAQRPPGCKDADRGTVDRINAGLKTPGARVDVAYAVPFSESKLLALGVRVPGKDKPSYVYLISQGDAIYDFAAAPGGQPLTTFGPPPRLDRVMTDALVRAAKCLQETLNP